MPNRFHEVTSKSPVMPLDFLRWPNVALVNRAKQSIGVDPEQLAGALQDFVAVHFGPIWNSFCTVEVKAEPESGDWPLLLVDDDGQVDAVAFHDATNGTGPKMVVDVTKALKDDGCVSLASGHELAEALVDPYCGLAMFLEDGCAVAYETVDPVQDTAFEVRGLKMPNFVTPEWFNGAWHKGQQPFDYCGAVDTPLTLSLGGYAMVYYPLSRRWTPVFRQAQTLEKIKGKLAGKSRLKKRGLVETYCIGRQEGYIIDR